MAADDSKSRIADAISLFNWGFANCRVYSDDNTDKLSDIPVTGGVKTSLPICYSDTFRYLDTTGSGETLNKTFELPESLDAPLKKGDIVGKAVYSLGETEIGEIEILAAESIPELTLKDTIEKLAHCLFLGDCKEIFS